jgi:hypothetical protein
VAYSFKQLKTLWINAGGPKAVADIMAAIALAESGGNPSKTHVDANGSVDRGLWQINSVHGYPPSTSYNAQQNAQQAVSVWHSQGFPAWTTYKTGVYLNYMSNGSSSGIPSVGGAGLSNPIEQGSYARIDQGTDYVSYLPVHALAAGKIVGIYPFAPGEGVASHTEIVERFDNPVAVGGHIYYGGYYAEEKPLVKPGQHVKAGDPVMAKGSNELGFLVGQNLVIPGGPNYPLGSASYPTKEGKDYEALVSALGGPGPKGNVGYPGSSIVSAGKSAINDVTGGWLSGIESLAYQGFFVIIGLGLILVGLALIAWTVMGRTGAPGLVGMAQSQMRIRQAGQRTEESQRASMVRESQATGRLQEQREARALRERSLAVREQNISRRQERYVVKDKPNQVVRKKQGNPASGAPRRDRG